MYSIWTPTFPDSPAFGWGVAARSGRWSHTQVNWSTSLAGWTMKMTCAHFQNLSSCSSDQRDCMFQMEQLLVVNGQPGWLSDQGQSPVPTIAVSSPWDLSSHFWLILHVPKWKRQSNEVKVLREIKTGEQYTQSASLCVLYALEVWDIFDLGFPVVKKKKKRKTISCNAVNSQYLLKE